MRKFLSLFTVLMLIGVFTFAQERTVSGVVTGPDNHPLDRISVQIQGTNLGTITKADGSYSLAARSGATLIFSGVGFETTTLKVGESSTLNVSLQSSTKSLSEVVVTALGIQRSEKSLGYSVSQVNSNEIVQKSEPELLKNLQGKVPGVDIRIGQGAPGAANRIQIRGVSSIGLGTQPLFVVDGVPYANQSISNGSVFSQSGAVGTSLNNLDPNDIKSMSVLKGSAAAALYGSRGANGVILITTKSGSGSRGPKPLNVNYSFGYSLEKISALPEFQNEYGAGANMLEQGANGSWGAHFGKGVIYNGSGAPIRASSSGVDSIPATTWGALYAAYPELFPNGLAPYKAQPDNVSGLFQTGHLMENSVNFNGGNANSSFNATLSNTDQTGYITNSLFQRNNASVGGQTKAGKFTLGANVSYAQTKQLGGYLGQAQSFISQWGRTFTQARNWNMLIYPTTDKQGNQIGFNSGQYTNPIWAAYHNTVTTHDYRSIANVHLTYKANDWISVKYTFGVDNYQLNRVSIVDKSSYGSADNAVGNITEDFFHNQELNSTVLATFTPRLGNDLTLTVNVGNDVNQRKSRAQEAYGADFTVSGLYNLTNTSKPQLPEDTRHYRRIVGFFGDATLGYKGWAYLNVSGREDMTSTLEWKHAKYFYPAFSGSLIWSDAFKIKNNWLDYGKVRLGYARVGNDPDPQNGQAIFDLYGTTFLGQPRAQRDGTVFDPDLKPEFSKEIEAGLDFQLFKNRIRAEITWYDKKTTDLIYPISLPYTTGFTSFYTNIGEIENKGWEIGLDVKPVVTHNFSWDIFGSYTRNRNTVNKLVEGIQRILVAGYTDYVGSTLEAGMPYGYFRGTAAARYQGKLLIDPNTGNAVQDRQNTYLGDPNPNYKLGITNTFKYKGFTLSALFDMTIGGQFFSEAISDMLGRGVTKDTRDRTHNVVIDGYYADMNPVPDANGELHFQPLLVNGKPVPNQTQISVNDLFFQAGIADNTSFATNAAGEFNIWDGTVYHLREITFGYNIPVKWAEKLRLANVNISVSGRNLWFYAPHIPKYMHRDPELSSMGTSQYTGFDIGGAPAPKRYGVNLNVTF